jgi:hypothetical protein
MKFPRSWISVQDTTNILHGHLFQDTNILHDSIYVFSNIERLKIKLRSLKLEREIERVEASRSGLSQRPVSIIVFLCCSCSLTSFQHYYHFLVPPPHRVWHQEGEQQIILPLVRLFFFVVPKKVDILLASLNEQASTTLLSS